MQNALIYTTDRAFNYLQSEFKRCYFVTLRNISSKLCVPIGKFVPKSPNLSIFREKSRNRKQSEHFLNFQIFLTYIDC